MLKIDSNTVDMDYLKYLALLYKYPRATFNVEHLDKLICINDSRAKGCLLRMFMHMKLVSGNDYTEITPAILINYLVEYEEVPRDMFTYFDFKSKKDKETTELDRINFIYSQGYAREFLDIYIPYAEMIYALNGIKRNRLRMKKSNLVGYNGKHLYELAFYYKEAVTGRTYTRKASTQGIGKGYLSGIQAPEDYYVFWCDFNNIDFAVALEICLRCESQEELDKYLDLYVDKYEAFARYMYHINGLEFDYDNFLQERGRYKQGILACIYQSSIDGLTHIVGDAVFAKRLHYTINTNPRYIEFMNALNSNIEIPENFDVQCYFGKNRSCFGGGRINKRSIFNTPVQGTSQEVMEIFTRTVCSRMSQVMGDSMKFFPMFNRHDEMLFVVHKDCLPHMHLVIDCMKIQVDDWKPLELKWGIGKIYGECDEEVTALVNKSVASHPPKMVTKSRRLSPYYPSARTLVMQYVKYYHNDSSFKMAHKLADSVSGEHIIFSRPGIMNNEVFIRKLLNEVFKDDIRNSYDRVVLFSDEDNYMCIEGVDVFIINASYDGSYATSLTLLKRLCNKYITNKSFERLPDDLVDFPYIGLSKEIEKTWWI